MTDATSIRGITVTTPPVGIFTPHPMPDGDTADGYVLGLNPATGEIQIKRPHVTCGPSALTGNISLPANVWTSLWGSINYSSYGFRDQFVAYIPNGVWRLDGRLVVAGPTNCEYDVQVLQGMNLSSDPGRAGIICDNPILVGGGVNTWTGAANYPFTIPFTADVIQCAALPGQAAEISVRVKAHVTGGSALGVIGDLPAPFVSTFFIERKRSL